ncbi:reverse transcriptase domain-containing protein [Trichonephila clavipes]|uniref:Reverse transcriptase domain-containing protein n=1 Tax=Trichonephila clavipes TaxID=2585209 RepID=A0A8X6W144_TRICX|nr:reverse transcriptase domain-containing protein [Trichonephila clavipes]
MIAFADDLLLCFQIKSFHDISRQAQLTLDFASTWTKNYKLEFNAVKSKVMFLEKRENNDLTGNLTLNGFSLDCVKELKYLGVVLDSKFCWKQDVLHLSNKLSRVAEKHLTSNTCFSITDSRLPNVTSETIRKASRSAHFTATSVPSGITLRNETDSFELMLKAVMKLRRALPDVVTSEQEEAILFKANNGALEDTSSYADVRKEVFRIVVSVLKDRTEVFVCRTTTIN